MYVRELVWSETMSRRKKAEKTEEKKEPYTPKAIRRFSITPEYCVRDIPRDSDDDGYVLIDLSLVPEHTTVIRLWSGSASWKYDFDIDGWRVRNPNPEITLMKFGCKGDW